MNLIIEGVPPGHVHGACLVLRPRVVPSSKDRELLTYSASGTLHPHSVAVLFPLLREQHLDSFKTGPFVFWYSSL